MKRDAEHVPWVESGSYPLRAGNEVVPLVDGLSAFRAICRAVEEARHSVWLTIAFLKQGFEMPDGRGTLLDVLDRAAGRGLDVRALFWRSANLDVWTEDDHFPGSEAQRRSLAERGSRFLARWDSLPGQLCHHQKSWLVDAGEANEIAFVGGINLDPASVAEPGHPAREIGNIHDVYAQLRGPSATDVHHNFVQRWNEASERNREDGVWPGAADNGDLPFPSQASPPRGEVPVQIGRTIHPARYSAGEPTPGGKPFAIADGESSVCDQLLAAIDSADSAIYIEDQLIASPGIIARLDAALARGIPVVFLVPGNAHPQFAAARRNPDLARLFEPLGALGRYEHFCLAGIASCSSAGAYHDIYVHAKIALVDDGWATIGSTNVADRSFREDTEMNVTFWHGKTVRGLRVELLREHLKLDTAGLDAASALRLYQDTARKNAVLRARRARLEGLAFAIDPERYGL